MQKMQEMQQQTQGQEIPPEQMQQMQQQLQQEIAQETEAMTPPEVLTYMKRVHQDPAEALAEQLLSYLKKKLDLALKLCGFGWAKK